MVRRRENPDLAGGSPRTPGKIRKTRPRAGGGQRKKTKDQEEAEKKMAKAMWRFLGKNNNQDVRGSPKDPDQSTGKPGT